MEDRHIPALTVDMTNADSLASLHIMTNQACAEQTQPCSATCCLILLSHISWFRLNSFYI